MRYVRYVQHVLHAPRLARNSLEANDAQKTLRIVAEWTRIPRSILDPSRERGENIFTKLDETENKYEHGFNLLNLEHVLFSHVLYQLSYLGFQGVS